jgi:hypothetical protein
MPRGETLGRLRRSLEKKGHPKLRSEKSIHYKRWRWDALAATVELEHLVAARQRDAWRPSKK